jgi:hypothetical protein
VRALFTMNQFQHTICLTAALPFLPKTITMTFGGSDHHEMSLVCYGPLGYVLNRSQVYNYNLKDEEDDDAEPKPILQVEESSFLSTSVDS